MHAYRVFVSTCVVLVCFLPHGSGSSDDPSPPSTAMCNGTTTAADVAKRMNLSGKVVIVTGGDGGMGLPVVEAFAEQGATVIIASRNLSKCSSIARRVSSETGSNVQGMQLDLSSFDSVRSFVSNFLAFSSRLDVLINNAGIAGNSQRKSDDGFQLVFAINYMGPFLLTELLLPALRSSGSVTIHYDDGFVVNRSVELYGFTKFLSIQHALELSRREDSNVEAFSLTPGWVNTSLASPNETSPEQAKEKCKLQYPDPCPYTREEGAAMTAVCALLNIRSGGYYSRINGCQEEVVELKRSGFQVSMGAELYNRSLYLIGHAATMANIVV